MNEPERDRLSKLQTALILAAQDMDQAAAAARALKAESKDVALMRALETAIVVCYMRAFTKSSLGTLPSEYVPAPESVHTELKRLRDKVYAHTDAASERSASTQAATREGDVVEVQWREQWRPLSREALPTLIAHFEHLGDAYRTEAATIHVQLHGLGAYRADQPPAG
jgi:hypothetical protein